MKSFKEHQEINEQVLYRGHAKGQDPKRANKKGITWVTPNKKLASTYGDEVSEVKFNIRGKQLKIPEINKSGTVIDLLKYAPKPKTDEQQKLYDEVVYHFGGGTKRMELPKFLHKIGSEKVIKFLKSVDIKIILAIESGIITYGILS
jgi:hypothetical protein